MIKKNFSYRHSRARYGCSRETMLCDSSDLGNFGNQLQQLGQELMICFVP
jgi:hypothetical protein